MSARRTDDLQQLKHQSLGRALTAPERALADAMLAFFRTGATDFAAMANALQQQGIARPSGAAGPWTPELLHAELARINADLDTAYAEHGTGF